MTTLEPTPRYGRPYPARRVLEEHNVNADAPRSLAQAVQAAARAAESRLRPETAQHAGLAIEPRVLLALLSCCYARQIYGSAEVEQFLRGDAHFCQLYADQVPDVPTIRRFRRDHREALQVCLTAALRFVAEQKVAEGVVTRVNEAQIAEEASRRIIMAMFIDSMELDRDQTPETPVDLCYLFANGPPKAH